jgi:DNA-binding CsgD family transcriptional regulator
LARQNNNSNPLTPREQEILKLLAEGHTSRETANILNISTKTADAHRNNIRNKLGIHNLPGLVKYAITTGLTTAEANPE